MSIGKHLKNESGSSLPPSCALKSFN